MCVSRAAHLRHAPDSWTRNLLRAERPGGRWAALVRARTRRRLHRHAARGGEMCGTACSTGLRQCVGMITTILSRLPQPRSVENLLRQDKTVVSKIANGTLYCSTSRETLRAPAICGTQRVYSRTWSSEVERHGGRDGRRARSGRSRSAIVALRERDAGIALDRSRSPPLPVVDDLDAPMQRNSRHGWFRRRGSRGSREWDRRAAAVDHVPAAALG